MLIFHQPAVCPPKKHHMTWFPRFQSFPEKISTFFLVGNSVFWCHHIMRGNALTAPNGGSSSQHLSLMKLPKKKHIYQMSATFQKKTGTSIQTKKQKTTPKKSGRVENTFAWETRGAWSKVWEDAREEGASKSRRRQSNFGTTHVFLGPFF